MPNDPRSLHCLLEQIEGDEDEEEEEEEAEEEGEEDEAEAAATDGAAAAQPPLSSLPARGKQVSLSLTLKLWP